MAKESSAINDLIALVSARPLARESSDELLFQAPPAARRRAVKPPPMRVMTAPPVRPIPVLAAAPAPAPAAVSVRAPRAAAPRSKSPRRSVMSLAIPGSVLVLAGVLAGGYLGMRGGGSSPAAAASIAPAALVQAPRVTPPAPAPAPAPAVAPVAPAPPPSQAAGTAIVRIESTPPGATVTIAGAQGQGLIGTTPIDATLDRSRVVDLVFALDGHPRLVRTVDPARTREVSVTLESPAPAPVASPAPSAAPAPAPAHHHHHHAVRVAAAGTGTLMISTKPPCSILVDGRSTSLVTPQRALALPAGAHRITLVNSENHVKKTIAVRIHAHRATKVVRDFMHG